MMISQGSSEANISLIVDEAHLNAAVHALSDLVKQGIVREVTHNHDVCAVAVVGAGMAGAPGTGGRIFTALGKNRGQCHDDLAGIIGSKYLVCGETAGRSPGSTGAPRRIQVIGGMR